MATILYLVRHAETVWNQENRFQGQQDVPLSGEGRRQAARLARRLRARDGGLSFDALWSSDLSRAYDTASAIGEALNLDVVARPEFREMHFGAWEGLTFPEVAERFPESAAAYRRDSVRTRPPGGESFLEMQTRVAGAFKALWRPDLRRVILVAHGGCLKALICHLLDLEPELRDRFVIENTGLTLVRYQPDRGRLLALNDTAHLEGCG